MSIDLKPDPSHFKGDNLPIEQVGWEDAIEFCVRLSCATEKTYRLPTEAEWEYACRATTTGLYAGNLDAMAWYTDNSHRMTHPVGMKQSNGFGLYDIHGNVSEWCMDTWHENYDGAPTDGTAWTGGNFSQRMMRGGSYAVDATVCRSAVRSALNQELHHRIFGFRIVTGTRRP